MQKYFFKTNRGTPQLAGGSHFVDDGKKSKTTVP